MKMSTGHSVVVEALRKSRLKQTASHEFEVAAPDILSKMTLMQDTLKELGYVYSKFEFKHSRLPKITMEVEPDIKLVLSQ